jgi:hypothetical protein
MESVLRELVAHQSVSDAVAVPRGGRARQPPLSREDLRALLVGMPDVFFVPTFITDFVGAYLRARQARPLLVVDLWAAAGLMLPPLVAALRPARAIGILPAGHSIEIAELVGAAGGIEWRAAEVGAAAASLEPGVDVVLGCPPWSWRPRRIQVETPGGPLILAEDPANVALLESCARLAPNGIGLFIVGPGFVMRPGPGTAFANLERFGLSLQLMLEMPRGIFSPDSGSGRLLIGIGPEPCSVPVMDWLTPEPLHTAALLDSLQRPGAPSQRSKDVIAVF